MPSIVTSTLDHGLTLICEPMSGVRSLGLTWLLPAGSARDPHDRLGLSAIWEELLLRGAGALDSRAQADALDRLGLSRGTSVDAFNLSIGVTMLGARLADALPLIADMALRPTMDPAQLEPVRDLCIQEIEALQDEPADRVMLNLKRLHNPPPLNRSNLGEPDGLAAVRADELLPRWKSTVVPRGSVLAIAGDIDPAAALDHVKRLTQGWAGTAPILSWNDAEAQRGYTHEEDQTNQVHIALCHDAPPEPSPDSMLERIATAVLSGGMSGRLFTEVREKRSLCYSVYASYRADARFGRTVAYSGTTPERAQQTLDQMLIELRRIATPEGRITADEFDRAVIGMKSRLVMSGESTSARAGALAGDFMRLGRARSLEEVTRAIDAVTVDQVNQYLSRRRTGPITVATIGPAPLRIEAAMLAGW